ncbi:hypothetical protein LG293_16840 (plasmid) [Citricoccus nitrophenolicus]
MSTSWIASLLKVRGIQEDQAASTLAQANARVSAHASRAAKERALLEDHGGQVTLAAAGIARAASYGYLADIRAAQQIASSEVEVATAGMQAARQARRSAELLRDRHEARAAELRNRMDQNELDELASTAHHRRQKEV